MTLLEAIVFLCSVNMHGGVDPQCQYYMIDCTKKDQYLTCQTQYLLTTNMTLGETCNPRLRDLQGR
jgi:hypothetical protein